MKKFAKIIRISTIAPIAATILINTLFFFKDGAFNSYIDLIIAMLTIVIIPILSYPLQSKFNIIHGENGNKRDGERKLAIIISTFSYTIGMLYSIIFNTPVICRIMFMTYFISGILISLFTFALDINSSGHMCGITGPIVMTVYVFGYIYLILLVLLILVIWSSLYLKRHTITELIFGTITPVVSLLISIILFTY